MHTVLDIHNLNAKPDRYEKFITGARFLDYGLVRLVRVGNVSGFFKLRHRDLIK